MTIWARMKWSSSDDTQQISYGDQVEDDIISENGTEQVTDISFAGE